MINIYASSFITGFQDIVEFLLKKDLKNFKLVSKEDGFIIYKTTSDITSIINLPYINNSFLVLHIASFNKSSMETYAKELLQKRLFWKQKLMHFKRQRKKFRIMAYVENQPTRIPKHLHKQLENEILKTWKNLILDSANPEVEFRISKRKDEPYMFMLRLTKKNAIAWLNKGEIKSEFAYFINSLAELCHEDIVIDPFVGYGGLVKSILQNFAYKQIIVNDLNSTLIQQLKQKLKDKNIIMLNKDFRKISFRDYWVNAIITDPPRGLYEKLSPNLEKFYEDFIKKCSLELTSNGKLVICTYQKEITKNLLLQYWFKIQKEIHTLLSGKKVVIFMALHN